jgi:hypothetical protein
MTIDAHTKQVVAVGLAYAISILERAPTHWISAGLLFDLHTLLDESTDNEPNAALKRARAHVRRLLKEPAPELH